MSDQVTITFTAEEYTSLCKALASLGALEHQQAVNSEARSVASFCNAIVRPLLQHGKLYGKTRKSALRSLQERGRNAIEWMKAAGTLPTWLRGF
jgi:predicted DNA-binding transcriptional regulator YafY